MMFRLALICLPGLVLGQKLTLQQAIESAETNNRSIRASRLERAKMATQAETRPATGHGDAR